MHRPGKNQPANRTGKHGDMETPRQLVSGWKMAVENVENGWGYG